MSNGARDVVSVNGLTGYGKSTWLEQYLKKYSRVIIFDPFRAIPAEYISGDSLIDKFDNGELRDSKFRYGLNALPDLPIGCSVGYLTGNCALVIEECGYCFDKGERIPPYLAEAIFLGRHQSFSLIFTAQRAVSIPIELRSQSQRYVTFCQTEPNDVKWCREKIGEYYKELPTLPKYVCFDSESGVVSRYMVRPHGTLDNSFANDRRQSDNDASVQSADTNSFTGD